MRDEATENRDPLDVLVDEFVRRMRAGESVEVEAFAAEHAEQRDALLDLLPTLKALEQVKRDRESTGGLAARVALPTMDRLGDFRIVQEVGRGGMGVVFEAVQESLSRRVALKVLPQASLLSGNQLMRFQREAQTAAQLHHSNIVPVFGSGETDGYHWYAMQFIDGEGLDAWRKTQSEAPPAGSAAWRERARFVAELGEQTASALHYAHSQGTLHRDIKPANLLLERGGHVWVTDFGLAKALEAEGLTRSGDLLGTLQYMAPEQFAGQYDARSEVYALGVTLFELLTLQPAYAGKTKSELMAAIRSGRSASLRRLCPELPGDLMTIVEKSSSHESKDRYASAEALQHDLQAFLEDRPIAARRQSTAGLVLRWCRRNRAMAAVGAVALVAGIAAGVTGWVAYVVTDDALSRAQTSGEQTVLQSRRAEANLRLSLRAFDEVFDALVGRDPVLMFEEDPDTGEQEVIVTRNVDDGDIALLEKMLSFYDEFAAQNAESQSLRFETARAYRRVGVIQARLGNVDAAVAAYVQALKRYTDVNDRDVTRELAAVHVEYGELELRRRDRRAAASRFRFALQLLEQEPAIGDTRALRFDRANAHFQLARASAPSRGARGRGPGGRRPNGRRPDNGRPDGPSRVDSARQELEQAHAILATLLQEDRGNPDVQAFEARCLLLSARLPGREDAERAAESEQGLELLRELVAAHPQRTLMRFELCENLLNMGRRASSEERLARLHEAREHAEELVQRQPGLQGYRELRVRVAGDLGGALLWQARGQDGAERQATRQAAEAELRRAIAGPGQGMRALIAAGQLDVLLRAEARIAEADAELERTFTALRDAIERGERPDRRLWSRNGRGESRRDPILRGFSPEFRERIDEVRKSMPRLEPPERRERSERPRRNGR